MSLMSWIRRNLGLFRRTIIVRGMTHDLYKEMENMWKELDREGYDVILIPEDLTVEIL